MSDSVLATTKDGYVHLVRSKTADGAALRAGDPLDGESGGRVIEDVVDLGTGARLAEQIRGEGDPAKLADRLADARADVARTTDRFGALFGGRESGLGKLATSIGQLFKEILARTQPAADKGDGPKA